MARTFSSQDGRPESPMDEFQSGLEEDAFSLSELNVE